MEIVLIVVVSNVIFFCFVVLLDVLGFIMFVSLPALFSGLFVMF